MQSLLLTSRQLGHLPVRKEGTLPRARRYTHAKAKTVQNCSHQEYCGSNPRARAWAE
jgi:hypothetical protein